MDTMMVQQLEVLGLLATTLESLS